MVNIFDTEEEKKAAEEQHRATAVALKKYGIDDAAIPKIIAAGYGKLSEQIVEIAFRNGVKVREDKEMAQILAGTYQSGGDNKEKPGDATDQG